MLRILVKALARRHRISHRERTRHLDRSSPPTTIRAMQLSVVVPAYNETHRIRGNVERIVDFLRSNFEAWEVIVVDDGSKVDAASALQGIEGIHCLRNEVNRGKGYCVRRGMLAARLHPILFTDADLSTPIEDARKLWDAIEGGADVAIGSRLRDPVTRVRRTLHRRMMALGFRLLVKLLAVRGFHDTQCGFKMFRRAPARTIFSAQRLERWGFDVEVLWLARRMGLHIAEVPVSYRESDESRLSVWTPFTMTRDLLRIRWNILRGAYRSLVAPQET
ncbi:MAG TPA: dolichyl-phosphate beta-glucosyltransferase, partial [Planctomycetota bacterium]|nr:dolichyl-phosphate beta-glucosyltransferase [Planctomycetota bacterium]